MQKGYQLLLLLLISLSMFQCRKEPGNIGSADPDIVIPGTSTPDSITPEPITANLQGNILDENNLPAEAVAVTVGLQTVITDSKGFFRINNAALDKVNSLVHAEKIGYFKAFRRFAANAGTNYVSIKMLRKIAAGEINSIAGGEISLGNNSKIKLNAGSMKLASNGTDYSGTVKVYAQYIDPGAPDIGQTIPGSFSAINKEGKKNILTSYGMMAIELESISGEKLQVKDGYASTLTTIIPAASLAYAPATIPLWYLDEQTGLWREDGTAVKQGNAYVGDVKHFTFWNCDFGDIAVTLSMTILNSSNVPLINSAVRITRPGTGWLTTAVDYTDSLGQVSGIVPYNENLLLEVLDPCGNIIYSQNLAPITTNTNLGNINSSPSIAGIVTITGKLVDCNLNAVTNGRVTINFQNNSRVANTDAFGNYQASFVYCANADSIAYIDAIDFGTGGAAIYGASVTVNLTAPVSHLSDIVVCTAVDFEYINYNLDGVDYRWTTANSFQIYASEVPGTGEIWVSADDQPGTRYFRLTISGTTAGTFPASWYTFETFGTTGGAGFTTPITTLSTGYPTFYEGSFSGQYTDNSGVLHNINGTFKVQHQ